VQSKGILLDSTLKLNQNLNDNVSSTHDNKQIAKDSIKASILKLKNDRDKDFETFMSESQRGKEYLHDKISKGLEMSKNIDKDKINKKYNLVDAKSESQVRTKSVQRSNNVKQEEQGQDVLDQYVKNKLQVRTESASKKHMNKLKTISR